MTRRRHHRRRGVSQALAAHALCDRTSRALAAETSIEPTMFPEGRIGFVGDRAAFATRMRDVLGAV